RDFFRQVQEQHTVDDYANTWCKILWLACLAVHKDQTLTLNLVLTPAQTSSAEYLLGALTLVTDSNINTDSQLFVQAMDSAVALSTVIFRHKYEVVNKVNPQTGASQASSYLVPRAINLLSLRSNGTFRNYKQITHITAAIRYFLRSLMLYNATKDGNEDNDDTIEQDIAQYLSPVQASAFAYCVQVHAACNSYGSNDQLPTITWVTDDYTTLRLTSGALLSLHSLKGFLRELYREAED
ncbi:hypothetical protein V1505DRAFT_288635, partial [Lipomyces doorenjongii]